MPKTFSVLIVDDIPLMRLMFAKYVKTAGKKILEPVLGPVEIVVTEATDGDDAETKLDNEDFDLVFLDLMMPQKDGLSLLRELRQKRRYDRTKVVVCSAVGEKEVVTKALEIGAQAYIVKPFTLDSVRGKLEEIYRPAVSA